MTKKHIAQAIALAFLVTGGIASAQTTTSATTTPGVANTGSGGNVVANMLLLGTSALVAVGGTAYLARKHA